LFCAKGLWFFDVFAPNLCAESEIWGDLGGRVGRENSNPMNRDASKEKRQSAKLREPDVVGMGFFIGGGRQEVDLWGRGLCSGGRGADWGLGRIGFELGLFFSFPGRG